MAHAQSSSAPREFVSHASTAETISLVGDVYALLATGAQTGGAFYLHEGIVPPGGGPPPHCHSREDEGFYVLDGTLTLYVEGRRMDVPRGSFVWAPRGQRHRFANESDAPVRMLVMAFPAGIEGMFRECGQRLAPGSTTPAPVTQEAIGKVIGACGRYGIEIEKPGA